MTHNYPGQCRHAWEDTRGARQQQCRRCGATCIRSATGQIVEYMNVRDVPAAARWNENPVILVPL